MVDSRRQTAGELLGREAGVGVHARKKRPAKMNNSPRGPNTKPSTRPMPLLARAIGLLGLFTLSVSLK